MRPLGEADRILSLFSRERGKLSAVAKGIRRTKSKYGARLDFFARSQVTLHAGRSLDIITGATLVGGMWERIVDPDVFAYLSYVAEVVDGLSEPDFAVPEVFELLCELQAALAEHGPGPLRATFDLRLLAALGLRPELDACVRCGALLGKRPLAGGRAALSPEAGGLVCAACLTAGAADAGESRRDLDVIRIGAEDFQRLRTAGSLPLVEAAAQPALARLARVTHAFVQHHLGRRAKALGTDRPARRGSSERRRVVTAHS